MASTYTYLDYSATAPVRPEVREAMLPYLEGEFGNPASIHTLGRQALNGADGARREVAEILNCEANEIVWTSGGTESDNLAILGIGLGEKPAHIVTSAIEHKAVLAACERLSKQGWRITYVRPTRKGLLKAVDVLGAIEEDTRLVSIIYAQNEIGTIQPIREIGKGIEKLNESRNKKVLFHTDAVQAGTLLNVNTKYLHVDLLTLSGHKLGGPKGIGLLFVRNAIKLTPLIMGGEQESNRRSGTLNVPGIVGMAMALKICQARREKEFARLLKLQKDLLSQLARLPRVVVNGDTQQRLPSNINVSIKGKPSDELVIGLDRMGIGTSAASACSSGSIEPSHVLLAIGLGEDRATTSLRITMGYLTKAGDIKRFSAALKSIL